MGFQATSEHTQFINIIYGEYGDLTHDLTYVVKYKTYGESMGL